MKKSILYLSLIALLLSCHEDDLVTESQEVRHITFNTTVGSGDSPEWISTRSASEPSERKFHMASEDGSRYMSMTVREEPMTGRGVTRGAQTSTAAISTFGVSGALCMRNSSYTAVGCGSLFYKEEVAPGISMDYAWPTSDYKLSFFAYYPYGNDNLTMASLATEKGIPAYSYTVPEDAADHVDVMTAQVTDMLGGQQSPVTLSFNHRCTALRFRLTNTGDNTMTVRSVTVAGVKYTGTLRNATWTLGSDTRSSVLACNDTEVESGETVDLTDGNYMFMLPQTLPATAKVILETEKNTFEGKISGSWAAGQVYTYSINANDAVNYLRFTAIEDGTFTLTIPASVNTSYLTSVSYSLDDGDTWVTTENTSSAITITTPTVTAGNSVVWKGDGKQYSSGTSASAASKFSSTGRYNVSGSIMSLLYGSGVNNTVLPGNYTFIYFFNNNTKLVDASELLLPATTLRERCYAYMFNGCTSLTTAPELPAMKLETLCYGYMFYGCTSLTAAPELPATQINWNCYSNMFNGCTSMTTAPSVLPAMTLYNNCYEYMFASTAITEAPELPAMTMRPNCYQNMFYRCKSLTTAPELPATTLNTNCYKNMFCACTSLTTAPELPAMTLWQGCYQAMFSSCTALTTAPSILPAMKLQMNCYYEMFSGCSALMTAPELPATTLAQQCYAYMFAYCSSLTAVPELPATTLQPQCYAMMFNRCTKLNYVKAAFVDIPYTNSLTDWLTNVSKTGTFVKNAAATWTGYIPSGWTVETYTPE